MTTQNPESGDFRRDELIAGEYVLGVLSAEDRRKVEARMVLDRSFAAMVGRWQHNLSSLEDEFEPVSPPPRVLSAVERRLFADAPSSTQATGGSVGFWSSLALWRGLTLSAVVGMAAIGTMNSNLFSGSQAGRPLVAELSGEASASLNLIAQYDGESGRLRVTPVAARQTEEKSLELWLIVGDTPGAIPGCASPDRPGRNRHCAGASLENRRRRNIRDQSGAVRRIADRLGHRPGHRSRQGPQSLKW